MFKNVNFMAVSCLSIVSSNYRAEMVVEVKKEAVCSRKAEREKLHRDKLKEQFLELGKALGNILFH